MPPSFNDLLYNSSLVLSNTHVSYAAATRLPQNYKPIGGFHIDEKVKPLPEVSNSETEIQNHNGAGASMYNDLENDFNVKEKLQVNFY